MKTATPGKRVLLMSAGLAVAAAFATSAAAQQPAVDCRATLEAYVMDKSLNVRREGDAVVVTRAGIEYVCRCYVNTFPPVCRPGGDFMGAGGLGGADLSRFEPGEQIAVMAVKTLIQGLFNSIYGSPSMEASSSGEDALRAREDMLGAQEGSRKRVLEGWELFRKEEKKRLQDRSAASDIDVLIGQYGAVIQDLLEISRKLAEVRRQMLDAAFDIRETEARAATDDLLGRALASKEEAQGRLKIVEDSEAACLEDAERAEDRLRELDDKLKKGAGDRGKR
jgi:hypothetical protein